MLLPTARLQFDRLRQADAEALFHYRADPAVARYQGWYPRSIGEARQFIAAQQVASPETSDRWVQWAIRLREDGSLVGDLGVHTPATHEAAVEFGVTIVPSHQRQGYASEAVHTLFARVFGVLGRHRVQASVDPRNVASVALLRDLGLRQEAHHRESLWLHGEWVDDLVFALLQTEWRAAQRNADPAVPERAR